MSKFSIKEDTLNAARNGDNEAMNELIRAFAPTVERIAASYVGRCPLTHSDLIQEGMIGLLSSVYGYSSSVGAEFTTYSVKCISNCIMSAVRNQLRNKHIPLNSYVLIDSIDLADGQANPEVVVEMQDRMGQLREKISNELSSLEQDVLRLHIAGHNYNSIAEKLSVTEKTVDNALQRARKKLKEK
ncbi:MAG: sigma-70 family RNA polymerase sigma factor [Clostridia bacterium]|nr:sigma-70 family RNA polymerase sigma factor [Clostridia bacterium]